MSLDSIVRRTVMTYSFNFALFLYIPAALTLCSMGLVSWYVFLLVTLSQLSLTVTWSR